jgi:NADH-quinone oxidoreductase subunit K
MLPITSYLFLSFALLFIGIIGALTRRNLVIKLLSTELALVAAAINFTAFARLYGDASGQIFAIVSIVTIVLQLLVALAIVAAVFRRWNAAAPGPAKDISSQRSD